MNNRKIEESKLLWHMDRVEDYFRLGKKVSPICIDMGITKKCNINCCYCYGNFQGGKTGEVLNRAPLFDVFDNAYKLGIRAIAVVGDGEPTLNPHLYEALERGKKTGLSLALSTNGILLDNEERQRNILNNCDWMRFNLSAGNSNSYEFIHNSKSFNKVVENIASLVKLKEKTKSKCDIGIQSVYIPRLMDSDMVELACLSIGMGVDYFLIKQCCQPDKGESGMFQFDLNEYNTKKTHDLFSLLSHLTSPKTEIIVKAEAMQTDCRKFKKCLDLPFLFQISGNGKCYPCGYLFNNPKYEYGDLNKQKLEEILKSDRYWKVIKDIANNFDVKTDCRGHCRHNKTNEFIDNYLNKPESINFI